MTKKVMFLLALVLLASPLLAQTAAGSPAAEAHQQWVVITAGFSMAIASGLCGLARNPGASAAIRFALLLGLVLIESLALYTLVIIFVKVS